MNLLLSIRDEYLQKILNRQKTIEIRKTRPKQLSEGDTLWFWNTQPYREIGVGATCDGVLSHNWRTIWDLYGVYSGMSYKSYMAYADFNEMITAIWLKDVFVIPEPLHRWQIRSINRSFRPPRTHSYIESDSALGNLLAQQKRIPAPHPLYGGF